MGSFDLVMCFSVTMWIHLNRGDEGLEEFVKFCCGASRNVLVEPQPWKCYQVLNCSFYFNFDFFSFSTRSLTPPPVCEKKKQTSKRRGTRN